MVQSPFEPRFTQPWNVPELMLTAGHIYVDLDTDVREGIVDRLVVWGYSSPCKSKIGRWRIVCG